jgi:parvulin-like peptidyl-prolyl isomerase
MKTLNSIHFKAAALTLGLALATTYTSGMAATSSATTTVAANTSVNNAATPNVTQSALPPGVIASVNGVPIQQSQVDQLIAQAKVADTPTVRANLKNELIARELFRQAAEQKHYDTRTEVQQAMQQAKINAESQLYLREAIHPTPVTDAQVKARYDEIVAGLGKTEYKPRMIQVADDATANAALAQIKSGTPFDAVAKQYSTAANKASGGELPWVSFKLPLEQGKTQGLPLEMAQAIVQLSAGHVTTTPVVINGAIFILKVDQVRPTQVPPFDQAQASIRAALEQTELQKATLQVTMGLIKNAQIQQ